MHLYAQQIVNMPCLRKLQKSKIKWNFNTLRYGTQAF